MADWESFSYALREKNDGRDLKSKLRDMWRWSEFCGKGGPVMMWREVIGGEKLGFLRGGFRRRAMRGGKFVRRL